MAGISFYETRAYNNSIYTNVSFSVSSTTVQYRVAFYINGYWDGNSSEKTGSLSYSNITHTYYGLSSGTTYTVRADLQYYNTIDRAWLNSGYSTSATVTTTSPTIYYLYGTYHKGTTWESERVWPLPGEDGLLDSRTSGPYTADDAYSHRNDHVPYGYEFDHYDTSVSGVNRFADFYFREMPTYSITYDANGGTTTPPKATGKYAGTPVTLAGSISHNSEYWTDSSEYLTVSFEAYGGTLPANKQATINRNYTKTYSFSVWQDNGTSPPTNHNAGTALVMPARDVTLKAVWSTESRLTSVDINSIILPTSVKTGYTLNGWYTSQTGGTRVGGAGDSYTPSVNTTLHAQWSKATYMISIMTSPAAGGTASGGGTKEYGSTCTLSATPNPGYIFDGWYEDGSKISSQTSYQFAVTKSRSITAKFVVGKYSIAVSTDPSRAGTVSGGGDYNYGSACTISVTYDTSKYIFSGWYENDTLLTNDTSYSFTVIKNRTFVAKFTYVPISYFTWTNDDDTNIDVGQSVSNLSANRWNTVLKPKILLVASRQGKPAPTITEITGGTRVGATLYEQVKAAIASLTGSGTLPKTVHENDPIRKGHFNGTMIEDGATKRSLKEALNKAIDYTNTQG